jgi:hypothetical protein
MSTLNFGDTLTGTRRARSTTRLAWPFQSKERISEMLSLLNTYKEQNLPSDINHDMPADERLWERVENRWQDIVRDAEVGLADDRCVFI